MADQPSPREELALELVQAALDTIDLPRDLGREEATAVAEAVGQPLVDRLDIAGDREREFVRDEFVFLLAQALSAGPGEPCEPPPRFQAAHDVERRVTRLISAALRYSRQVRPAAARRARRLAAAEGRSLKRLAAELDCPGLLVNVYTDAELRSVSAMRVRVRPPTGRRPSCGTRTRSRERRDGSRRSRTRGSPADGDPEPPPPLAADRGAA